MDLQQMRYVVEVAGTGSFTRAAARCFVTQSALSHQIAALERELGQMLFTRTSRSVRLTEAGEAFLRQARIAVSAADAAKEDAVAAAGRVIGTLRVGVIPTVAAVDVPALIARFREAHAAVRVELTVGNSDALIAAVRRGDLDVALIGLRADILPGGVGLRMLARERLVVAVPPGHELSGRDSIRLHDLAGAVFADFPAGTSGRAQGDTAFAASGLGRDVAFEADSAELLLGLVAAGLAVTLLSPGVVRRSRADVVPVEVLDGPLRVEYAAWDARAPRAAGRAFLAVIEALLLENE
ncbi:LysR family transcriptional regulator [Microbacterium sp. OR16]|uniref:LysR family transcriptional regulator n=1 Tax=Microbacterium sp. OR16 TaxID=3095345 RepID=UPI0039B6239F